MSTADGGAKIAHAIRRSTALYLATMTMPEGTSDADLFARADSYANWLLGRAGAAEANPPKEFMGVDPWAQ